VSGQAFVRRAPVRVADYSTWEHAPPDIRALGRWSAAAVPLLVGDQAIGALGLYTPVSRPLTPDDVQTLTLVAAQIAPALETARLHATAEQRRAEAEALADLARQSVSEPDLERVITLITEYACRLLGADYAAVALCEPDGTLSLHGRWGRRSQAWDLDRLRPEQTLAGRALAAGQPVVETLAAAPPDAYPVHRAEGGRTLLSAPLVTRAERAGGEAPPPPLGAITLGWRRDVTLTPEQVHLAEALAGHAAILVANARSRAALAAHAQNLRQLAAIAAAVTAETDLTAILDQIVRATTEIAGLERNSILLLDPSGRTLHHAAAIGLPAAYLQAVDGLVIGPAAGTCGTAAYRGEIVITEDALTDPLWAPYRSIAETYGFRAVWSVPLRGPGERVLGTLAAYPPYPGRPTPEQLELLELYARLAAVAVENARAHAALAASEARLRTVYEAMTCGVIVHAADGRILDANSAAEEFLGLTRDQMRGRQPHELWELFDEEGQPLPLERRMVRELQRRRQPIHDRLLALRRPDGEYR
jgi:PAS domain S-box-containing protein